MTAPLVAVTGAGGFLGSHVVAALLRAGMRVRVLARSNPYLPAFRQSIVEGAASPEIVRGDLQDKEALATLVRGAAAVIHCAGLVKSVSRAGFFAANEQGTRNLAEVAQAHAPDAHLIVVSSLAAREPGLSSYAASKRAGEEAARQAFGGRLSIVRPPAVYGPGDRETLTIFKLASLPLIPLIGAQGRAAMIHANDAAEQLAALAGQSDSHAPAQALFALPGPCPSGYGKTEIMENAAAAMGRRARFVLLPEATLHAAALGLSLLPAAGPRMLTPEKVREILHLDWSIGETEMPPAFLPAARIGLAEGFKETVSWYRSAGWLR